jgi:hypothetical protein
MNRTFFWSLVATLALFSGTAFAQSTGPTSKLYVESNNTKSLYIIQGNSVIAGPAPTYCNHCESAIAVDGDIRSLGTTYGYGGQYNLDLTQTGTTYDGYGNFQDATTDGLRNYAATQALDSNGAYAGIDVYGFGRDWSNPSVLFHLDTASYVDGITYDPTNNSLWIVSEDPAANYAGLFQDFSMSGQVLTSFAAAGFVNGLALDYADGTLWTIEGSGQSFDQYSKTGQRLQKSYYESVAGGLSTVGIEFDLAGYERVVDPNAVPEPGLAALLGIGFVGWCSARRRRRG